VGRRVGGPLAVVGVLALLGLLVGVAVARRQPDRVNEASVDVPISPELMAIGDNLLSETAVPAPSDHPQVGDPIFVSTDLGESWEAIDLPNAPDEPDDCGSSCSPASSGSTPWSAGTTAGRAEASTSG
jgi:hypothetical protein